MGAKGCPDEDPKPQRVELSQRFRERPMFSKLSGDAGAAPNGLSLQSCPPPPELPLIMKECLSDEILRQFAPTNSHSREATVHQLTLPSLQRTQSDCQLRGGGGRSPLPLPSGSAPTGTDGRYHSCPTPWALPPTKATGLKGQLPDFTLLPLKRFVQAMPGPHRQHGVQFGTDTGHLKISPEHFSASLS